MADIKEEDKNFSEVIAKAYACARNVYDQAVRPDAADVDRECLCLNIFVVGKRACDARRHKCRCLLSQNCNADASDHQCICPPIYKEDKCKAPVHGCTCDKDPSSCIIIGNPHKCSCSTNPFTCRRLLLGHNCICSPGKIHERCRFEKHES